ncbi:ATP-dependent DNA ligase [Streptomyces sp. AC555_RSS877]|uniref:ATP-dependent DNA ligase n=1 Tax=Streptomyces sp. AC555_RSS877 TaxID=2823688 RepID=UPI001C26478C|nr:ATP-dependent DNA ligase [Streptomyces sp. AC555_RSS877]
MTWTLPEPMLTSPTPRTELRPGWAAEPKWDGYRALLLVDAGRVVLRSRRGTEMVQAFPEVVAGVVQLPDATALDGELVVWEEGRLAFERLQGRLQHRGAGAVRAAAEWPVHFVAFDVLRLSGSDTTGWPYRRRRAALESVFTARRLTAPWALSPSTTDPATVEQWLTWTAVGMEGVVFKRLDDVYRPSVRGWLKYKARHTDEAIVGAVTGTLAAPRSLLLGRYDADGRLRYAGRTVTLAAAVGRTVGERLTPPRGSHPWRGWAFSVGWGSREVLEVILVQPDLVAEVGVDVARDGAGRWRHPVRLVRIRTDLSPADVSLFAAL